MDQSPLIIVFMFGISVYIFKIWLDDYRSLKSNNPNPNAFPGATSVKLSIIVIGVIGALIILLIETGGEYLIGVSAEQSDITVLFLLSIISAGFIEEIIFRGFLVVDNKGKAIFLSSVIGFSILFALFHPFLWEWTDSGLELHFTSKAIFSTIIVFINSLWFYFLRFNKFNTEKSLIPCFAAHVSSNIGVFVIKLLQGHVTGFY